MDIFDNEEKKDIHKMTVKELRQEIRNSTYEYNERIKEFRETGESSTLLYKQIKSINKFSNVKKGKYGEVGTGDLSRKTKAELQTQLNKIQRFLKYDVITPKGKKYSNVAETRSYQTFIKKYGYISESDYEDMWDTMETVKETLKDYGYEDFSGGYAEVYVKADNQKRRNFAKLVAKAKKESRGRTTEDVLDTLKNYIFDNEE